MDLRYYQVECIKNILESLRKKSATVVCLPTGTGKSLVIAELCKIAQQNNKKVLCITHNKDLVQQNEQEYKKYYSKADTGICCAGLNRKEVLQTVIFATVQTYINIKNEDCFNLIIIDEAHRIPPGGNDSQAQYNQVIAQEKEKNPKIKIVGLTATPYRMGQGLLIEGEDRLFEEICYSADFMKLVKENFLCFVTSMHGGFSADTSKLHLKKGEFIEKEATEEFMNILPQQVDFIIRKGQNRKKWIVFCQSVEHAKAMHKKMTENNIKTALVLGDKDRDIGIKEIKDGNVQCVVNVNVLTTGFNVPDIDMIVLCRATASTSLYVQMVGRGTRVHPSKKDCLVLDFGENIERHGPIDLASQAKKNNNGVAPVKVCPQCGIFLHTMVKQCECGHEFELPEKNTGKNLKSSAAEGGILSSEALKLHADNIEFEPTITKSGYKSIIMSFLQDGERWPICRVWLNLWHDNEYARQISAKVLDDITKGNAHHFLPLDYELASMALNDVFSSGEITKPDFIYVKQEKDSKYLKYLSCGWEDK